jgi:hypothetical protein
LELLMDAEAVSSQARADWLPRAITSGFVAAVAMLFTFMVAYAVAYGLGQRDFAEPIQGWFYGLTHNALTNLAGSNLYAVAGLHFLVAMVWAAAYGYYAEPRLPGPGWIRGVSFSLLTWLVSILVALPLGGGGILGAALGAGPLPVLGNLVLHFAYGATLGAVYGPLGDVPADSLSARGPTDDFETTRRGEVGTAVGIVAGLVAGLIISLVIALLLNTRPGSPILGIPEAAFVLACTVLGGAFGALLGSLAGLGAPRQA